MTLGPTREQKRRVILLREETDLSYSVIGRLTGLSKGSVGGILQRAGKTIPGNSPIKRPAPTEAVELPVTRLGASVNGLPADAKPNQAKRLCQWIFGEPGPGQHWIDMPKCSERALVGSSYCEIHCGRAHKK